MQAQREKAVEAAAEKETELLAEQFLHKTTCTQAQGRAHNHLSTIAELQSELDMQKLHLLGALGELDFASGNVAALQEAQEGLKQRVLQLEAVATQAIELSDRKVAALAEDQGLVHLQDEWAARADELTQNIAELEALVL